MNMRGGSIIPRTLNIPKYYLLHTQIYTYFLNRELKTQF